MTNQNKRPKEPPFDEEGHRNLVEFYRLLLQIDARLKGKHQAPPIPQREGKVDHPNLTPQIPKGTELTSPPAVPNPPGSVAKRQPLLSLTSKNLTECVTVRLDPETLKLLRTVAEQKGIGPTTLIRMWVRKRL